MKTNSVHGLRGQTAVHLVMEEQGQEKESVTRITVWEMSLNLKNVTSISVLVSMIGSFIVFSVPFSFW